MPKFSLLLIRAALIILGLACVNMISWSGRDQDSNGWASALMVGMMKPMKELLNLFSLGNKSQNSSGLDRGVNLFSRYCAQCHPLPSPSAHAAADWPIVADRMFGIMSRMAGHTTNITIPSLAEQQSIVDYLKAHSAKPAS